MFGAGGAWHVSAPLKEGADVRFTAQPLACRGSRHDKSRPIADGSWLAL